MGSNQIISADHDREAWLRWRKNGVGASESAALLGHGWTKKDGTKAGPLDVYIEKTSDQIDLTDSLLLRRGRDLEPIAAARYTEETGRSLVVVPAEVHRDFDFMRASADREAVSGEGDGLRRMVELKTMFRHEFERLKLTGLPMKYWIQVQHQLEVYDCDAGAIGILQPDSWKFLQFDIERDRGFGAELIGVVAAFWQMVVDRNPPPRHAIGSVGEALPPITGGTMVDANSLAGLLHMQFIETSDALIQARAIAKEAEEFKEEASDRMRRWLDKNGFDIVEGNGIRVYWTETSGRKSFDKVALAAAHPEIKLSQFEKTGKPFRSLRVFNV
jgi:putative phage-type endonuclease